MKLSKLVLLGLPLVLFGCPSDDDDTDTDPATETDTDDTDPPTDTDTDLPPVEFVVELIDGTPDQMVITVVNGTGAYDFGYAQTAVQNGWFGEDCYLGTGGFQFCHEVTDTLTLDNVATPEEVVEDSTMLLSVDTPAEDTPPLTYYVSDGTTCWVWGDDISYYAPLNCEEYIAPM